MLVNEAAADSEPLLALAGARPAGCRGGGDDRRRRRDPRPGRDRGACPEAVNEDNGCIYLGQISDLTPGRSRRSASRSPTRRRRSGSGSTRTAASAATTSTSRVHPRQPVQPRDPQPGLQRDRARRPGARADAGLAHDRSRSSRTSKSERNHRGAGVVDLAVGVRGQHPRVRRQLLHRGDERRRLRGRGADVKSVMAVGFPGDYGGDGAAGVEVAAEANGLDLRERRDGAGRDRAGRRDQRDRAAASPTWSCSPPARPRPR